jgi:hypothetical protein
MQKKKICLVPKSPTQMGSLSAKNANQKFSRLGTFKERGAEVLLEKSTRPPYCESPLMLQRHLDHYVGAQEYD